MFTDIFEFNAVSFVCDTFSEIDIILQSPCPGSIGFCIQLNGEQPTQDNAVLWLSTTYIT